MTLGRFFGFFFLFLTVSCGFHRPPVTVLPDAEKEPEKILFIAIDGIGYEMMHELQKEGYFSDFQPVVPLTVTFPSATTIGFTGIFKPLDVGLVPGYESRFYSYKDNEVIGGTPGDIYKIHVNYKTYFDAFRHTMHEKAVMYAFPGVAGKEDLMRTEKLLLESPKKVIMTYLGGTDGAQHLLGRNRMMRFMIFVDRFITRMKKRYRLLHDEPLKVVLFSDHGFHFDRLKMVGTGEIEKALNTAGLKRSRHLVDENDVVVVEYGLLSAGVMMTHPKQREKAARSLTGVDGIDLVFWPEGKRVHMVNSEGEEAYFDYHWSQGGKPTKYRYVPVSGDPLDYFPIISKSGYASGDWIPDGRWKKMTAQAYYPDAGYRLYDSFFNLVENKASVMFSVKPNYQFGGFAALAGTYLKFGHKGTHGGLFRDTSTGMVMTDDPKMNLPDAVRYDEMFKLFLPQVTRAYQRRHGKREIQFLTQPH
ncbi:MAG: alkaline phosphatase family protein [Deltaproteobacteria bacterium]|nr:alkaline phosphatase family protein [Deltaproteobacteria bacterium]